MDFWFHPSSGVLKLLNNINSPVLYRPKHRLWSIENKKLNHIINFWMISILVLCEGIWKNHISGLKILLTLVRISNVWHIGWDHEWNIMNFLFHPSSEVLKLLNNINSRVLYRPKHRLWSLENKKLNHIINF